MQFIVKRNSEKISKEKKNVIYSVIFSILCISLIIVGFIVPTDKDDTSTENLETTKQQTVIEKEKEPIISAYNKNEILSLLTEKTLKEFIPENAVLIIDDQNNVYHSKENIKEISEVLELKQFERVNIEFNEKDKKTFETEEKIKSSFTYLDNDDVFLGKISLYKNFVTFEINAKDTTAPVIYYFPIL